MSNRTDQLRTALRQRLLVLDSAMGTAIQDRHLDASAFGGDALDGCNENLIITAPDVIASIHQANLDAGCDIIESNTFGGTPLVLDEYQLGSQAALINRTAAELARELAENESTPDRPRFVAGSIGPTTRAISVTGGVTFDELIDNFYQQADALHKGGVDYFLLETCQDTRNIKAALLAIEKLGEERGVHLPVAVSISIEPMGTMLAGQGVEALAASLSHVELLYLGLNCGTGPDFMTDHIRSLAAVSPFPIACVPNAGMPDEDGRYLETPHMMGQVLQRFGEQHWLNLIGGCCGTRPDHVAAFVNLAEKLTPHVSARRHASVLSGIEFLEVTEEMRPVIVGERTNVIGSRKFKRLIVEGSLDEAVAIGRAQVKNGAQIVDVCLANPDRDEAADMDAFLSELTKAVHVPLMIDSTDAEVIELALTYCQGKAIINSVNLEDGLERFEKVVPLARRYGAALVVGCIDDDPEHGMAITRQRKLEIAKRSLQILTEDFGMLPEDIYFDPLVFPCATGDEAYLGAAAETIEGVRLIKESLPGVRTVLGISNVSFGLPPVGREVMNSVFLHHCVEAGLDLALVNAEKLERYGSLDEEALTLANNLLFDKGDDPVGAFAAHYRDSKPRAPINRDTMPLDERLAEYIIEGSKDGLTADLDEKMQTTPPLEIINGPLMQGMDMVGKLFNENKLIVAEVLQSAESMKAAVTHLEPHLEMSESSLRGTMLLATVKGDVHDIGKNLVDIIFSNNGFRVINLGIKITPAALIAAVREHKPDLIGLSGLLVKSAHMMVTTAEDLTAAGVDIPLLVGGAALTEKFVRTRINASYKGEAFYAKDAMSGLDLAKRIRDPEQFNDLVNTRAALAPDIPAQPKTAAAAGSATRSIEVPIVESPPPAPDYAQHILRTTPLGQIWRYLDYGILFRIHMGFSPQQAKALLAARQDKAQLAAFTEEHPRLAAQWALIQEMTRSYIDSPLLEPRAVYQFFRCQSDGNRLLLWATPDDKEPTAIFDFPRQSRENGLCLSDYANPVGAPADNCCAFVVSIGSGTRAEAERLKNEGEFLRSHLLLALAIRSAEAYAEWLHKEIRRMWGIDTDLPNEEIFRAKYIGQRYSFGYPACPSLKDQAALWKLLHPEVIGCQLTDEMMMDPEASVSALVFHHPKALYFNANISASDANE